MKSIVFLFAGFPTLNAFNRFFDGKSAFDLCLEWAGKIPDCTKIVIAASKVTEESVNSALKEASVKNFSVDVKETWNTRELISSIADSAEKEGVDSIVYSMADRPFLDAELSLEVIETHKKYIAEYSCADGYPAGFSPEVIDSGAAKIIKGLSESAEKSLSEAQVNSESIFNIMKNDLNAFDIEAVVALYDYRLLRLNFSVSEKINAFACINLFKLAKEKEVSFTAKELSELARVNAAVQKTVPAFYNVQTALASATFESFSPYHESFKKRYGDYPDYGKKFPVENMSIEEFRTLAAKIAELSENAVVSLSFFGDPVTLPELANYVSAVLEYSGLSVLIETDGVLLTSDIAESVANIVNVVPHRTNGMPAVSWIIKLDAFTQEMYDKIHLNSAKYSDGKTAFEKAKDSIVMLKTLFPSSVYPQFTRLNENEAELEQFYRFWHEKTSPSDGNVIIQKYDNFCGILPDKKPADLSPVHRNPCWHLKRDLCILPNGDVPLCREQFYDAVIGNVFKDGLETVWEKLSPCLQKQMEESYEGKCGACDEYYTFNF